MYFTKMCNAECKLNFRECVLWNTFMHKRHHAQVLFVIYFILHVLHVFTVVQNSDILYVVTLNHTFWKISYPVTILKEIFQSRIYYPFNILNKIFIATVVDIVNVFLLFYTYILHLEILFFNIFLL